MLVRACLTNNYRRKYHSGTSRVYADPNENIEGKCTFYAGIEHESPQVIVFEDGKPIWSASLYDITATGVEQAAQGR